MNKIFCFIDYKLDGFDRNYVDFLHPLNKIYVHKSAMIIAHLVKRGFRHSTKDIYALTDELTVICEYLNLNTKCTDDVKHLKAVIDFCDFAGIACDYNNKRIIDIFERSHKSRIHSNYDEFSALISSNNITEISTKQIKNT